jgi:hypothetical protein
MEGPIVELDELNDTELWELLRLQSTAAWGRPIRLSRGAPREYVIRAIDSGEPPYPPYELLESRAMLQTWIRNNWTMVNSQIPCSGPLKGNCTMYPCPEGRHLSCFKAAEPHFKLSK